MAWQRVATLRGSQREHSWYCVSVLADRYSMVLVMTHGIPGILGPHVEEEHTSRGMQCYE